MGSFPVNQPLAVGSQPDVAVLEISIFGSARAVFTVYLPADSGGEAVDVEVELEKVVKRKLGDKPRRFVLSGPVISINGQEHDIPAKFKATCLLEDKGQSRFELLDQAA